MSHPIAARWIIGGTLTCLAMLGVAVVPLDLSHLAPWPTIAATPRSSIPASVTLRPKSQEADFDELIGLIAADQETSPVSDSSLSLQLGAGQTIEEPSLWQRRQRWLHWLQSTCPFCSP